MLIAAKAVAVRVRRNFRNVFIVPEGCVGLLYQHGKLVAQLGVGRNIRWGCGFTLERQDVRKANLAVSGQEVLTADNVSVKVSASVSYQVVDAAKAAHLAKNWFSELLNQAQLALRAVLSEMAAEALTAERRSVAARLLALIQPEAGKFGILVYGVELTDLIYPAELKQAFAAPLKARQESRAAVERARGESAALRNLANAVRELEGNPELLNLRLLQAITTAQAEGLTVVLGLPKGFVPRQTGKGPARVEPPSTFPM